MSSGYTQQQIDDHNDETLAKLYKWRRAIIDKLLEIRSTDMHALNTPDVKTADGGTTLDKQAYIKQLKDDLREVDDAIKRHAEVIGEQDKGPLEPFEIRTQVDLGGIG